MLYIETVKKLLLSHSHKQCMIVSQETESFVASLQDFSHRALRRSADLASLIELSRIHHQRQVLDDLTFFSKFLVNTKSVMSRIGTEGEGYTKLSFEFTEKLEKASTLVRLLVKEAPGEIKKHFTDEYFVTTQNGLNAMMELLHDVAWLKNWEIDHRSSQ